MKALAEALVAVQKEIGTAVKSSQNPHFKSRYADLAEVWSTWQEVGPKHGLALTQTTRVLDSGMTVLVTTLLHKSGECMTGEYPLIPTKNDPQGMGSAMTYARRYCLAAMVGIVQDDDDGEAASKPASNDAKPAPKAQPKTEQVKEQAKNGVDTWIANEKAKIEKFADRIQLNNWRKAPSTETALNSMKERYPDKYADFEAYLDITFDTLPAGKAA